jgi:crotonobetainyl-CoA:carnitine CoA-transferase CaiB-like acyl-CoA transferase
MGITGKTFSAEQGRRSGNRAALILPNASATALQMVAKIVAAAATARVMVSKIFEMPDLSDR